MNRRDVIERPVKNEIDLSGWDVRKALKLFHKSNPPLLEWLQCPFIYRERFSLAAQLRKLLPEFYSPRACFYHYLHMAKGNIREYLYGETVWRKKYFYVLRPLLAMRWIEQGYGPVPIEFQKLVDATVDDRKLRSAISDLVSAKRGGAELERGPRIPTISDFVEQENYRFPITGVWFFGVCHSTAGIQARRDASADIHVNLGSGTPCRNDDTCRHDGCGAVIAR